MVIWGVVYYCFNHITLGKYHSTPGFLLPEVTKAQIGPGGLDANTPIPRRADFWHMGKLHSRGGTPIAGWFFGRENSNLKWMI